MLSNRLTTSHQGAELLPQLPEPAEAVTSTRPVEEHKKHMEKWEQNHKVLPRGKQPRARPAGEQQCREVELLVGTKLTMASSVPRGQQHTEPNSRCGRDPEGTAQPCWAAQCRRWGLTEEPRAGTQRWGRERSGSAVRRC